MSTKAPANRHAKRLPGQSGAGAPHGPHRLHAARPGRPCRPSAQVRVVHGVNTPYYDYDILLLLRNSTRPTPLPAKLGERQAGIGGLR